MCVCVCSRAMHNAFDCNTRASKPLHSLPPSSGAHYMLRQSALRQVRPTKLDSALDLSDFHAQDRLLQGKSFKQANCSVYPITALLWGNPKENCINLIR